MVCFAVAFYRIAEMDNKSGIIWAGLSVAVYFLTVRFIHGGIVGILGM